MRFQMELAGIVVEAAARHASTLCFAEGFLVSGRKPELYACPTMADLEREWNGGLPGGPEIPSEMLLRSQPLERQAIYRKIAEQMPSHRVLLMHGAAVSDGQAAYLFTAPSGTGKTTRAKLLIRAHPEFFILNGDKPLIRAEENGLMICGSPWKGKEGYGTSGEAPLKAVFLLERAEKTELTELNMASAFDFLLKQSYIPGDAGSALQAIRLLRSFEKKVRIFRFRSEPTEESVKMALRAASGLEGND